MYEHLSSDTFSANFYDRARGEACAAEVRVRPGVLFVFLKKIPAGQTLEWTLDDLESAREHDGVVILQHGKQFLEINTPGFRAAFDRCFPKNRIFQQGFFDRIGVMGCLAVLVFLMLPAWAFYKWGLPKLADAAAQKISAETEREIGDGLFKSLTAKYLVDTARTRLVQEFYDSLGFGGTAHHIRITVVREPVVNAFAVPGGQIVVFDSIIGLMDAPEELAGLLAHEASHVHLKHSTRAVFRELAGSMFLSLVLGNYGDVSALVVEQADKLTGLSYSRELELEADDNGLKLLTTSGIPPQGMPSLFRKMQATLGKTESPDLPTFLSTHPSMAERVAVAEEKIGKMETRGLAVRPGVLAVWEKIRH